MIAFSVFFKKPFVISADGEKCRCSKRQCAGKLIAVKRGAYADGKGAAVLFFAEQSNVSAEIDHGIVRLPLQQLEKFLCGIAFGSAPEVKPEPWVVAVQGPAAKVQLFVSGMQQCFRPLCGAG